MSRRGCFLLLALTALTAAGCGEASYPVSGVVKLDGDPVAGASVTFYSEDGRSYSGGTDASGAFKLNAGEKAGIPAGTYKVMVTKIASLVESGESAKPGESDYIKAIEKQKKENEKSKGAVMSKGGSKMMMPTGPGSAGAPPPKSELPSLYASVATTPLSFTVPLPANSVSLDLHKEKDKEPKKK